VTAQAKEETVGDLLRQVAEALKAKLETTLDPEERAFIEGLIKAIEEGSVSIGRPVLIPVKCMRCPFLGLCIDFF
jgi:hypothetical protein